MRLLAAVFLSVLIPSPALAVDSFEYLLDDADTFEESLDRTGQQEEWDSGDQADLESSELIPEPRIAGTEEARGSLEEEQSLYVRVRIDGVPVDLKDVPRDVWFAPYVRAVAEAGLVSGYRGENGLPLGLYGPADSVTIEQIAKIAVIASGIDRSSCGTVMLNAGASGRWSEEFIRCAEVQKWAVFSDGSVDIERPATRAEVVATMLQAFNVEFRASDAAPFTDVDSSTEFRSAIITAYEDNVVSGFTDEHGTPTGTFGPTNSVNRAEVAKIVTLAMQLYAE